MQTTQFRYIVHLLGSKSRLIVSVLPLLLFATGLQAQMQNTPQYDSQILHFGFNVAVNSAQLQVNKSSYFYTIDTLHAVTPKAFPGIGLGAITSLKLSKYFNLRAVFPQIIFAQRNLNYEFSQSLKNVEVESAYIQGSLLLKYKSIRHRNTAFYLVGGLYAAHDLSSTVSQSRSNTKPVVSLKTDTYGYEVGFGLDLYFTYFKFAPELKVSNGLSNALYKDPYIYARAINSIYPKMITLSFNFE